VTRVLYRLRFSSEQRPFDVVSLVYTWPLLAAVLRAGGIDRPAGEEADEQVTLAIETLSYHTELCKYCKHDRNCFVGADLSESHTKNSLVKKLSDS
jgi:hypothetical protein